MIVTSHVWKTTKLFVYLGYLFLFLISTCSIVVGKQEMNILVAARYIVFLGMPILGVYYTGNQIKSSDNKIAISTKNKVLFYLSFVLFMIFYLCAYLLLYFELVQGESGVTSIAVLVGANAFMSIMHSLIAKKRINDKS